MEREVKLKEGEYVRIKGIVNVHAPYKKINGIWEGGSSWSIKNPLIMLGKCKHKPKKLRFRRKLLTEEKVYYKKGEESIVCSNCGYTIKFGKELEEQNSTVESA